MAPPAEPAEGSGAEAHAPASEASGSANASELGILKQLLFRSEQARLDALQRETEVLHARVGDSANLEAATAEVLAGALRRAEVASHRELSQAMAPLVVAAIRSEIANSRDMMVEALYPITGRLVAASVSAAFRDLLATINARLDQLLSTQLWKLRLRSWMTGRPLNEILLEAAQRPQVQLMLALERDSGRLLAQWRPGASPEESSELISGLIAAISQFAAQAFTHQHGELRTLDMGASRILLRASARLIVAAEFLGEPHAGDEARMDRALYSLIESEQGNPGDEALARLARDFSAPPPAQKASPVRNFVLAGLGFLALFWGLYGPVRNFVWERRLRASYAEALASQPALSGWPLNLVIDNSEKQARLSGLVPPETDADAFAKVLAAAGTPYQVDVSLTPVATAASAGAAESRLAANAADLGQKLGSGAVRQEALAAGLAEARAWQAARDAEARSPSARLAALARDMVILFGEGADFADPDLARRQLAALASQLKDGGGPLRVVGYSDSTGTAAKNLAISQARAEATVQVLLADGVEKAKLVAVGRGDQTAVAADAEQRRNRRGDFRADRCSEAVNVIFSAKVMLLGDIGVGKSSLAKRLKFDKFDSDYKTTIGVDILTHELELAGGEPVTARLLLWDTDGDFGLHIFKSVYIAGASGALVISDASRPATIQSMFDLAAAFLERLPGRSVRAVVNKTDIVTPDLSGFDLHGLPLDQVLFSSAKTGEGVQNAFRAIAADIHRRL